MSLTRQRRATFQKEGRGGYRSLRQKKKNLEALGERGTTNGRWPPAWRLVGGEAQDTALRSLKFIEGPARVGSHHQARRRPTSTRLPQRFVGM